MFLHLYTNSARLLNTGSEQLAIEFGFVATVLRFYLLCRRKKFNGIEELTNDKGYMRRPGLQEVVGPALSSSPRFSAHSGDASHNFDKDAETDRIQPELMTSESLESGRESPAHSHELDKSGYVTPTVEELDKLEVLEHGESHSTTQSITWSL